MSPDPPLGKKAAASADAVRAIGQVVAALAAGVGVIYVVGGLIIWFRLAIAGNPHLSIVSQLPREVVISVGLVAVILSIAVGAGYALAQLVRDSRTYPRYSRSWTIPTLGLAVAAPTLVVLFVSSQADDLWGSDLESSVLTSVLAWVAGCAWATLGVLGWASYRRDQFEVPAREEVARLGREAGAARREAEVARKRAEDAEAAARGLERPADAPPDPVDPEPTDPVPDAERERLAAQDRLSAREYSEPGAVAISALLWALFAVPPFLAASASVPLADARACANGHAVLEGEFIGETRERVYVTDNEGDRIASIPLKEVTRVYVGDDALGDDPAPCAERP